MKKVLIVFAIALLISVTTAVVFAFAPNKIAKPSDHNIGITYEKAMSEKKPFVALFYVDWCTYCTKFMPKFKALQEIYAGKYNFVMINAEDPKYKGLTRKVGLSGYPTVFVFDPVFDNRFAINNALYGDLGSMRDEFDRYLNVRARMK